MEQRAQQRPKGLRKFIFKIRHFRSGKYYKACRRNWARLWGRPIVHFLHVRKAGGSAIKSALLSHAGSGPYWIECHPHRISLKHIPVGEKIIFAVRDPVSRYVSGFNSRLNQGAPAHIVPWSEAEELALKQYQTPNALALALASPDEPQRQEAQQAMNSIRHVRSSYWDWFIDEKTLRARAQDVLIVLRQKNLDEDFKVAARRLQLPSTIQLSHDPVTSNQSLNSTSQHLEPAAIDAIRKYYARDYQFIEICRELFALEGEI